MFRKKIGRTNSSLPSVFVKGSQSNNNLDSTFLPEDLTVGQINSIGQRYIENHPKKSRDHRNQPIAQDLLAFKGGSPQEMFDFLADKYEKLHGDATGEIAQQILTLYKSLERGVARLPENVFEEEKKRVREERNGASFLSSWSLSKSSRAIQKSDFTISILSTDYMEGDNTMDKVASDMKRITRNYFRFLEGNKQTSSGIELA